MQNSFMARAIELAVANVRSGTGGPFAAVVVKDGKIVATGTNRVTAMNDPTAHAEVVAIREACRALGTFQLAECEVYSTCEPCPMCAGAIYWARPARVYFGATVEDAAQAGFDDAMISCEMGRSLEQRNIPFVPLMRDEAQVCFREWKARPNRVEY